MAYLLFHLAFVGLFSAAAVLVMLWCRRRVGVDALRHNHEVAGYVYSVIGAIFAVTVALAVDTVHDGYIAAERNVTFEATQVANLHHLAGWFPDKGGPAVQNALKQYLQTVIEKEWPHSAYDMAHSPTVADSPFQKVVLSIRDLSPETITQQTAYAEMMQRLSSFRDARFNRLHVPIRGLPLPLLVILLFGGLITIGFTMFFAMENPRSQVIIVFAISAMVWGNIMMIYTVHYPYNGLGIATPFALIEVLKTF
jgi:hypothetical protein